MYIWQTTFIMRLFSFTGSKIEPYLPTLMERILGSMSNSSSPKLKELSISALGAIGEEHCLLKKTCSDHILIPALAFFFRAHQIPPNLRQSAVQ